MPVVLITASQPVRYVTNNIGPKKEFDPGVLYDVPVDAAQKMIRWGWARYASEDDLAQAEAKEPTVVPPPPETDGATVLPSAVATPDAKSDAASEAADTTDGQRPETEVRRRGRPPRVQVSAEQQE